MVCSAEDAEDWTAYGRTWPEHNQKPKPFMLFHKTSAPPVAPLPSDVDGKAHGAYGLEARPALVLVGRMDISPSETMLAGAIV